MNYEGVENSAVVRYGLVGIAALTSRCVAPLCCPCALTILGLTGAFFEHLLLPTGYMASSVLMVWRSAVVPNRVAFALFTMQRPASSPTSKPMPDFSQHRYRGAFSRFKGTTIANNSSIHPVAPQTPAEKCLQLSFSNVVGVGNARQLSSDGGEKQASGRKTAQPSSSPQQGVKRETMFRNNGRRCLRRL